MKIRSINAELFASAGALDWINPISIRIEFCDHSAIRTRSASDGESIVVDGEPLEGPCDMGEWGATEVHPLTDRFGGSVTEQNILAASKIVGEYDTVVGLALVGSDGPILCVWNYGDELYYGSIDALIGQDWGSIPEISTAAFAVK